MYSGSPTFLNISDESSRNLPLGQYRQMSLEKARKVVKGEESCCGDQQDEDEFATAANTVLCLHLLCYAVITS